MKLFVTGTDTNVGKTYVSCGLLKWLNNAGLSTIALKPVSSGCQQSVQGLINDDALALQQAASIHLPLTTINPFAFEPPVAPHIPAEQNNIQLTAQNIVGKCQDALSTPADIHLIEGVGGWFMPLNASETMADVAQQLNAGIIMVVGMRLGCLSHALLTYQAIKQKNCHLIGWIANCIDSDMLFLQENIMMLQQQISAPLMGVVHYQAVVEECLISVKFFQEKII
jgi:dethiobiotin synthetase